MKYFFLIISLFFFYFTQAQFSTNIYWTEQTAMPVSDVFYYNASRPLTWKDFKGQPDASNTRAAALTASGFGYKADFKNVGSKSDLNIKVYCYFNKNNSWVKEGKTTEYILNHEQEHFNISFIAASIFVEKLKAAGMTKSNFNSLLPGLYKECCDIMNKLQEDYDGQTKNGQLKDMQAKWDTYLKEKLKAITK